MAPVFHALRQRLPDSRHTLIHTGQHYDRELAGSFVEALDLPRPAHELGVGSGTHAEQTARTLERIERVLTDDPPDLVLVPGDVNSTLGAALAAVKLGIPVGHVEAGLRSFDRSMPEEVNRLLVDQISRWCFTHSPEARENLLREGVGPDRIHAVGNTMIDTLVRLRPAIAGSTVHERLGLERGRYLLVTLHRPALVDGPLFPRALEALARVADALPVVYPVHPRARSRAAVQAPGLRLVAPVGYVDFLALEASAAGVLTDSGGVQEETTFLGVPCFTLRDNTERPVTVSLGTNHLLGLRPEAIEELPALLRRPRSAQAPIEGWDGHAASRIADVLAPRPEEVRRPSVESAAR
jgi:UDP-N-acetylglucosamine 2-epimerase (non-hydrolysing)